MPIAQLDRALDCGSEGQRFKSSWARKLLDFGEMAEWLKAHAWKACIHENVSWVRIPFSPIPRIRTIECYLIPSGLESSSGK